MRRWLTALVAAGLMLFAGLAAVQVSPDWDAWDRVAKQARTVIDGAKASPDKLEDLRERLETQRASAAKVASAATVGITDLQAELDALGPAPDGDAPEAPAAAALRQELHAKLANAELNRSTHIADAAMSQTGKKQTMMPKSRRL